MFDKEAEVSSTQPFEILELPTWKRVMSIPLFLLGENQSKIQLSMLCFELERAHNIEPQHVG
jgi:hypothetical protein